MSLIHSFWEKGRGGGGTVFGDGGLRLCDESDMLSSTWFHSDGVQECFFFIFPWFLFLFF